MRYPFLILCSSVSSFLPLLVSLALLRSLQRTHRGFEILRAFFVLASTTEIALYILNSQKEPTTWIAHVYTLIEFVLISEVLTRWHNQPAVARSIRFSIPLYILFFILIKAIALENFFSGSNNYITRPIALLLLTAFTLLTLQDLWRNTSTNLTSINLTDDYRFWMLFAMALYYSTSLGLFAFMYSKNQELLIALFKIHAVINIIHNLIFTIGVFKVRAAQQPALEPTSAS